MTTEAGDSRRATIPAIREKFLSPNSGRSPLEFITTGTRATNGPVDKTIRVYTSFDEMKADEYRYWQSRPVHERIAAVSELSQAHYAMKGVFQMYPDFKELLSVLNAHRVKYLVVGGYAVSFHAQPRVTSDIDILIQPDPENSRAVYAALEKFGAPLQGLSPEDFSERGKFFRMGRAPVAVDILPEIDGIVFEPAWEKPSRASSTQ